MSEVYHTESIIKLSIALSRAQKIMHPAIKDASNPFFKKSDGTPSKYADLESVWTACRDALADNELSVAQYHGMDQAQRPVLITMLMHSSGEWIKGYTPIIAKDMTAQSMGSATTYARRYGLAAMVGVIQTDDDGNHAEGFQVKPSAYNNVAKPVYNDEKPLISPQVEEFLNQEWPDPEGFAPTTQKVKPKLTNHAPQKSGGVSEAQVKRLYAIAKSKKISDGELTDRLEAAFGITNPHELDWKQYKKFCDGLELLPKDTDDIPF